MIVPKMEKGRFMGITLKENNELINLRLKKHELERQIMSLKAEHKKVCDKIKEYSFLYD